MAVGYWDLRKARLPSSRILVSWAVRLGLMGRGGGGTAASRVRRERWRALRVVSSVVRGSVVVVVEEGARMALEVGSRCRGSWRKVSSIVGFCVGRERCVEGMWVKV